MIALMLAAALVAPVPAAPAPPPPCFTEYDIAKVGNAVHAYGYRYCDDQPPIPVAVTLQRLNPATGLWPVVASGSGDAKFSCFGTGLRTYRNGKAPALTLKAYCT